MHRTEKLKVAGGLVLLALFTAPFAALGLTVLVLPAIAAILIALAVRAVRRDARADRELNAALLETARQVTLAVELEEMKRARGVA